MAIRTEWNITRKELARASGLSKSTIQAFELGRIAPSYENVYRLAKALDVSMDSLCQDLDVTDVRLAQPHWKKLPTIKRKERNVTSAQRQDPGG